MADRYFPVRVRVAVPPHGLGFRLNEMSEWLTHHVGHRNYFLGGRGGATSRDTMAIYFLDMIAAHAFAEAFGAAVSLAIGSESERPP